MIVKADVKCEEVPDPIEYAVLRPVGNDDTLPLLYLLHGGNGTRDFLDQAGLWLENAWADGSFPPVVAVTPTTKARGFYMNFRDGSARWEDALIGGFLDHVRNEHGASPTRQHTLTCGPSMGGMGSLRLAFKHPEVFGGVAALEPGIEPVLHFGDIELRDRFWRGPALFEAAFGSPVDEAYWRANNPASIAHDDPDRLRKSGLAIYLECGDQDAFGLHRGTEFLHRQLYDHGISHEYRLVKGADHIGATLPERFADAFAFLAKVITPPPPDPEAAGLQDRLAGVKRQAGLVELETIEGASL